MLHFRRDQAATAALFLRCVSETHPLIDADSHYS